METEAGVQVQAPPLPRAPITGPDKLSTSTPVDDQYSDDEFEDASSNNLDDVMDLSDAFLDCEAATKKFFCNDVQGAMDLMLPYAGTSLYHSLGAAIFAFIPAVLTFDQNKIMEASAAIKTSINKCEKNRKQRGFVETLGSIIKKPNYALYSDQEAHAELCYAEALLLQAALSIIEGEDLAGLIKGTLKVRTCHNSYKHCWDMLETKPWESEESRIEFKSGVRLGIATFNLMISLLPPKFITLLEFAGFSGNKKFGLIELQNGSHAPGLRRPLCSLMILAYNLVMLPFIGGQGDSIICKKILHETLQIYPDSVLFLVFKGRYEFLQGNLNDALKIYKHTSENEQLGLGGFRHLCYWELMWINALLLKFRTSSEYAGLLFEQSAWSRTTYLYVKAAMLLQLGNEVAQADHLEVQQLMRDAPSYTVRIAGKSLPMEKFITRRCARYHAQKKKLILPVIELFCIWNLLPVLSNNISILQTMLKSIETTRESSMSGSRGWMAGHEGDNAALLHFMQGCVLSAMKLPLLAIEYFRHAIALKKVIKEDHFLIPYSVAEMAMCYFKLDDYATCKEYLSEARTKYSGYALESRLHFRIHTRQQMLREELNLV